MRGRRQVSFGFAGAAALIHSRLPLFRRADAKQFPRSSWGSFGAEASDRPGSPAG